MAGEATIGGVRLVLGDALEVLRGMEPCSVDAVVTDPPYGLSQHGTADVAEALRCWLDGKEYRHGKRGFMGRSWDAFVPGPEVWREVHRVLKPGGHAAVFAGSRTADLMGIALRLAGFEVRDTLQWLYGSGFPKSMSVDKAIDRMAGAEREILATVKKTPSAGGANTHEGWQRPWADGRSTMDITAPATDAARQWSGFGTALKPSCEPVLLVRRPLAEGSVAANCLKHGVGGLNVDACRVPAPEGLTSGGQKGNSPLHMDRAAGICRTHERSEQHTAGRWPSNVCHDGSPEVLAAFQAFGERSSGVKHGGRYPREAGVHDGGQRADGTACYADSGSPARFFPSLGYSPDELRLFYSGKASGAERDYGLDGLPMGTKHILNGGITSAKHPGVADGGGDRQARNTHPTVKPVALMQWLCKLITPPGGCVLDVFAGSGSTGVAASRLGMRAILVEREAEYFAIACERLRNDAPLLTSASAAPEPASEPASEPESWQASLFDEEAA